MATERAASMNDLPAWPRYYQKTYSPGARFSLGFLAIIVLVNLFRDRPFWVAIPVAIMFWPVVLPPLLTALTHALWVRRVGKSASWTRVAELVAGQPQAWVILVRPVPRGGRSFGTYQVSGGRDDFLLVKRDTYERYAIMERDVERGIAKAGELGVETVYQGETSERARTTPW